jgi:hypothetical protein
MNLKQQQQKDIHSIEYILVSSSPSGLKFPFASSSSNRSSGECHNLFKSDLEITIKNQFSKSVSVSLILLLYFSPSHLTWMVFLASVENDSITAARPCVKINNLWSQFHYMFFFHRAIKRRYRGSWIAARWQFLSSFSLSFQIVFSKFHSFSFAKNKKLKVKKKREQKWERNKSVSHEIVCHFIDYINFHRA